MMKNMVVFFAFSTIFSILNGAAPMTLKQAEAELTRAVMAGDSNKVNELLAIPDIDPDAPDVEGRTTLMKVQDRDIAELLLQAGANVNAATSWGLTPLMNVRSKDLAALFLQYGADTSEENEYGRTAEDILRDIDRDIADFIRDYKPTLVKGTRKQ